MSTFDLDQYGVYRSCNFCTCRRVRTRAEKQGKTVTVVSLQGNGGPANLFIDGRFAMSFAALPSTCTC